MLQRNTIKATQITVKTKLLLMNGLTFCYSTSPKKKIIIKLSTEECLSVSALFRSEKLKTITGFDISMISLDISIVYNIFQYLYIWISPILFRDCQPDRPCHRESLCVRIAVCDGWLVRARGRSLSRG